MDTELTNRWRQGVRPFDGPALVAGDLGANAVLTAVRWSLGVLHEIHGTKGLFVNEDWHDHDGLVKPGRPVSWAEVSAWARDIERLRESCSDDWRVHTLLFADDYAFCLRYWVGGVGESALDLCADCGVLAKLTSALRDKGVTVSIESSARAYLDRRWGG